MGHWALGMGKRGKIKFQDLRKNDQLRLISRRRFAAWRSRR
ncbi:hypothetical protein NSTC745_00124 [Nostoc sp. DSM 114161]|jgi:hypothetical protein